MIQTGAKCYRVCNLAVSLLRSLPTIVKNIMSISSISVPYYIDYVSVRSSICSNYY